MEHTYWQTQSPTKPLFPDMQWSRPERRDQAGRLGIVGGNKLGFAAVAESYQAGLRGGVGHVRVVLPDCLKPTVPKTLVDVVFAACNQSGSLAKDALPELVALGTWADELLMIGDAGRSSETAIVYEQLLSEYTGPLVVTRDAIDLVKNGSLQLVERPETTLVASFAQTQKLFQSVYYPKMITFSMQLQQLVEALHKFTITYPVTIMTLHREQLIIANGGEVVTQAFDQPMRIWRGEIATQAATWWLWNRTRPLQALTTSITSQNID